MRGRGRDRRTKGTLAGASAVRGKGRSRKWVVKAGRESSKGPASWTRCGHSVQSPMGPKWPVDGDLRERSSFPSSASGSGGRAAAGGRTVLEAGWRGRFPSWRARIELTPGTRGGWGPHWDHGRTEPLEAAVSSTWWGPAVGHGALRLGWGSRSPDDNASDHASSKFSHYFVIALKTTTPPTRLHVMVYYFEKKRKRLRSRLHIASQKEW